MTMLSYFLSLLLKFWNSLSYYDYGLYLSLYYSLYSDLYSDLYFGLYYGLEFWLLAFLWEDMVYLRLSLVTETCYGICYLGC